MTTINLKDYYPWYLTNEYIEVSDEVAAELRADKLYEAAYQRRIIRNKAQYSLDCDDGIEYSACVRAVPAGAAGAHGSFLPSLERSQLPAGDPRSSGGCPPHSWQELP